MQRILERMETEIISLEEIFQLSRFDCKLVLLNEQFLLMLAFFNISNFLEQF